MTETDFEARWRRLNDSVIDEAWFRNLRQLYEDCQPIQREELRKGLGWSEADCVQPWHPFGADWTERVRQHFLNETTLSDYIRQLAWGAWSRDYRDALIHLSGLYFAAILAGMQPHRILSAIASESPPTRKTIDGFLSRKDKWLGSFGFEAVRVADGRVHIQRTGS